MVSSGCTTSALSLVGNSKIRLQYGDDRIEKKGSVVTQKNINLGSVYVRQNIFRSEEGGIVVFEHAQVQQGYRYNYALKRSLALIFDARSVKKLDTFSNIGFFRVKRRSGSVVNVIAKNGNKRYISMLYGLTDAAFEDLLKKLKEERGEKLEPVKLVGAPIKPGDAILTVWNQKMIILDTLVIKTGGPGRGLTGKRGGAAN